MGIDSMGMGGLSENVKSHSRSSLTCMLSQCLLSVMDGVQALIFKAGRRPSHFLGAKAAKHTLWSIDSQENQ